MSDLGLEDIVTETDGHELDGALDDFDEEERPKRPAPTWLLPLLSVLVAFGVVVASFATFALSLSGIQEHRNQAQLYSTLRGLLDPSSSVAPSTGGSIPFGKPVALLDAPALGQSKLVLVQGSTSEQMRDGPGHLSDSPLPGQVGDSIIIGRGTTTGAPFAKLASLRPGDRMTITTGQGSFHFVVKDKRLAGSHLPAIPPSGSLVTLVTSTGPGFLGGILDGHLLYVDAALKGVAAATPHRPPHSITAAEIQGHGDPAATPWVLLWLLALLATALGSWWLIARWGWRRAWIVSAPIAIAVLWGLSDELLQLVANVY